MNKNLHKTVQAGVLAALYVALTYAQNILWPGSTSMAIQFRMSEALCVFAFFTPAAIPGLTVGCLLFNISSAGTLPLDFLVGTLATLIATVCMAKLKDKPFLGMLMPALWNAIFVGWELSVYISGGFTWPVFALNAVEVAIGEAVVLLTLGSLLYGILRRKDVSRRLFPV